MSDIFFHGKVTEAVWEHIRKIKAANAAGGLEEELRVRTECGCGLDLRDLPVEGYLHEGGWDLPGTKHARAGRYWLFVTCPKCHYQWAIWKLGIPRGYVFEPAEVQG